MLSPEVWHFREPASNFKQEIGRFDQEDFPGLVEGNIPCTHLVTAVIPDTLKVPEFLSSELLTDTEYYKVQDLPVSELVAADLLSFIKKGKLTALSVNTRIDCEDCFLVTPEAVLVLSLVKDTYQKLGVEGKVSHFHEKTRARYVVKIDLKSCKPGRFYERIKDRLSTLKATFILKWEPYQTEICPSSIAKYFQDRGFTVKECSNKFTTHIEYSVKVPHLDFDQVNELESREFVEWMGMLALGCDLNSGSPSDFITTYETPEPNTVFGQVRILQWRGFFSDQEIKRFADCLRKYIGEEQKVWVALYAQGFSDSPIGLRGRENHFFTNGDNGYVLIMNENQYLFCAQSCSNKQYK